MLNDRPVNSKLFNYLTSEIHRLTDQQVEALRMATLEGMTEDEAREYESRGKQIDKLVNQFRVLVSNRM